MNKDFIRIINEEISDFDFLNNDEYLKYKEILVLLSKEEFQKQFICDLLLGKNNIKTSFDFINVDGDYENGKDNANYLNVDANVKTKYTYDSNKPPVDFELYFIGENVSISVGGYSKGGNYENPPEGNTYFDSIYWNDINVTMSTTDGDDIEFIAYKNAPFRIRKLFLEHFLKSAIETSTSMEFNTGEVNDNIRNTNYC